MTPHPEDDFLESSLLERYCAGTASPEENAQIDVWFGAHPGRRVWYEQLRAKLHEGAFAPLSPEEYQSAWAETILLSLQRSPGSSAKLAEVMPAQGDVAQGAAPGAANTGEASSTQESKTRPFRGPRRTGGVFFGRSVRQWAWYGATASVLMLLAIGSVVRTRFVNRHLVGTLTYATGNGERATITLPDGGMVVLNVASRLEVPMDYMAGHRTVRLTGEGLFTASHRTGTPLTVTTEGATARVLGTSFVVRRYSTDTSVVVAVRDGKVAVGSAVVTANQLAEVGRDGMPHVRRSNATLFTFATGVLTIDGLSLPAAIVELNRWYDADVRLGDPALARERMKGSFGVGSLSDLAEGLASLYDVRVVRNGRVLTLYPK